MIEKTIQIRRCCQGMLILVFVVSLMCASAYTQTKRLSQDEAWELVRQANHAYFDKKDADQAIRLLQQVLASYPEGFRATSPKNRDELFRKGDVAAIERAFKEAGDERFDLDVDAFLALLYYQEKKDFQKAAYHAERAMRRYPNRQRGILEESRKMLLKREQPISMLVIINGCPVQWSSLTKTPSPDPKALLVSLEETATAADMEVIIDAKAGTAIFLGSKFEGKIKSGSLEAVVNDQPVRLSTAPQLVKGDLMVPLDFMIEHWKALEVRWNPATKVLDVVLPSYPRR